MIAFLSVSLFLGFLAFYALSAMDANKKAMEVTIDAVYFLGRVNEMRMNIVKAGKIPEQLEVSVHGFEDIQHELMDLEDDFNEIGDKIEKIARPYAVKEHIDKLLEDGQSFYDSLVALMPIKERIVSLSEIREGQLLPLFETFRERELEHQKFVNKIAAKIRKQERVDFDVQSTAPDHFTWYGQNDSPDPVLRKMFADIGPLHEHLHDAVALADQYVSDQNPEEAKRIMDDVFGDVKQLEDGLSALSSYAYDRYFNEMSAYQSQKEKAFFLLEKVMERVTELKKFVEDSILSDARGNMHAISRQNRIILAVAATMGVLLSLCIAFITVRKTENAFNLSKKINHDLKNSLEQQRQLNEDLAQEITRRKQAEKELQRVNVELEEMAVTDGLTGLYNHRYMNQFLHMEHNRAIRHHHELSVIMMDIDFFKNVNDSYGHGCGDVVLCGIAEMLTSRLRSTDIIARFDADQAVVARYGGEEIAVILPETDVEGAGDLAEDLRKMIEHNTFHCEEVAIKITVSIGVAASSKDKKETWSELLGRADAALYRAKNQGRNRVES
ncbi:MAG: GGDEF domain-containing protein [Desulfobulbaceae bacterium]|nr:GGDEF domain-containing protein [Desulfobulbaceae bacterium]